MCFSYFAYCMTIFAPLEPLNPPVQSCAREDPCQSIQRWKFPYLEVEPMAGIEPATDGLRNRCSTAELHWLDQSKIQRILGASASMASQFAAPSETRILTLARLKLSGLLPHHWRRSRWPWLMNARYLNSAATMVRISWHSFHTACNWRFADKNVRGEHDPRHIFFRLLAERE